MQTKKVVQKNRLRHKTPKIQIRKIQFLLNLEMPKRRKPKRPMKVSKYFKRYLTPKLLSQVAHLTSQTTQPLQAPMPTPKEKIRIKRSLRLLSLG
jgi:hypothetical protein